MAFGHASLPTRKFVYGVREFLPRPPRVGKLVQKMPPRERFEGHELAISQMRLAHHFQNKIVEIERKRRDDVEQAILANDGIVKSLLDAATAAQSVLANLRGQLKVANIRDSKAVADENLARLIRQQATATTSAWNAYQKSRRAAFHDTVIKKTIATIDEASEAAKSAARTAAVESGLYWPTSLQVVQRVKRSGPPPRFQSWDGEETISVQFQRKPDVSSLKEAVIDSNGNPRIHPRSGKPMMAHTVGASMSTNDIFKPNSMCWIERLPIANVPFKNLSRDHQQYVIVHYRVGSTNKGKPIWVKLPTILCRPLPPDAQVKWVHLMMKRVGTHAKWEVAFDVAKPSWDYHPAGEDRAKEGTVAIALGWRIIDGLVRVAEWVGDDGATGSIKIPEDLVNQWRSLESLQGIRDREFDRWKETMMNFVRERTDLTPEWQERAANLVQWNSPRRLASLVWWWGRNRLSGDDEVYRAAEGELIRGGLGQRDWYTGGRKKDKHIGDWQANLRDRLIAWRKDTYRKIAIDFSYQYKNVAIAQIDWAKIAENPDVEDSDDNVNKTNRAMSACAMLRDCFKRYLDEVKVDSGHITDDCAQCDCRVKSPGRGRWICCERCGSEKVDRAKNAAENILSRALVANVVV